jgi:hypothetical protein
MIDNMNQPTLFTHLKLLCDNYYNRRISFDEYRNQRNELLKRIDAEYNGRNLFTN